MRVQVFVVVCKPSWVLLSTLGFNVLHVYSILDFITPAPTEPAEVNRDVIYGTVIGILVLMLTVFITYVILKRRQRK